MALKFEELYKLTGNEAYLKKAELCREESKKVNPLPEKKRKED